MVIIKTGTPYHYIAGGIHLHVRSCKLSLIILVNRANANASFRTSDSAVNLVHANWPLIRLYAILCKAFPRTCPWKCHSSSCHHLLRQGQKIQDTMIWVRHSEGPPFRRSAIPGYYCYNNPNLTLTPGSPEWRAVTDTIHIPYIQAAFKHGRTSVSTQWNLINPPTLLVYRHPLTKTGVRTPDPGERAYNAFRWNLKRTGEVSLEKSVFQMLSVQLQRRFENFLANAADDDKVY